MTTPTHPTLTPVHIEYRNGTYYGQLSPDYKRNGKGMLILDTSTVIFAEWRDNYVQGMYIYMSDGIRAYGNMVGGKLDGYNIISTTGSYTGNGQTGQYSNNGVSTYQQQQSVRTFYGTFRNEKIYGRCVIVDNDSMLLCQYSNNQLEEVTTRQPLHPKHLLPTLQQAFPHHLYTLQQYLTKFTKTFITQLQQLDQITRYQPCINFFSRQSDEQFFGFQQISKPSKKFGVLMRDNQLVSVGEHCDGVLQGIGRLVEGEQVIDGAFRGGKVDGVGVRYDRSTNRFVMQVHDGQDDRVEKGFGFPLREILQFRKEFHLRSIFFYNDIATLNLKPKLESLIAHIFLNPKKSPFQQTRQQPDTLQPDRRFGASSRSGSKRIQNSPLRERLSRYQLESDVIEDSSPVKVGRMNQYRPVDRVGEYFKEGSGMGQGQEQQQRGHYNNSREGDRYSNNNSSNININRRNQPTTNTSSTRLSRNGLNQPPYSPHQQPPLHNNTSSSRRFPQPPSHSQQRPSDRFSQDLKTKPSSSNTINNNKFQLRESRQQQTYNQILRQNPSSLSATYIEQQRGSRVYSNYNPTNRQEQQYGGGGYEQQGNNARGRKDTRDLVKELENQEKGRRLALDQIYSKSNLYGRGKR